MLHGVQYEVVGLACRMWTADLTPSVDGIKMFLRMIPESLGLAKDLSAMAILQGFVADHSLSPPIARCYS